MGLYRRNKIWWTNETINGVHYRKSTGKKDRDEAKVKAAEILTEMGGKPGPPPKRRRVENPPLVAVVESYVRHQTDNGPRNGTKPKARSNATPAAASPNLRPGVFINTPFTPFSRACAIHAFRSVGLIPRLTCLGSTL